MNTRISSLVTGVRAAALLWPVFLLPGCAVVKINPGSTDTVEHSGGPDVGRDLANRVCSRAKAVRAEVLSTIKKEGTSPEGRERYVTTFRCLY